jgi:hypothetical protein
MINQFIIILIITKIEKINSRLIMMIKEILKFLNNSFNNKTLNKLKSMTPKKYNCIKSNNPSIKII